MLKDVKRRREQRTTNAPIYKFKKHSTGSRMALLKVSP
jgi:hypothetical protein